MGSAIWLFIWLVSAQTGANGLVLGGSPLSYADISRRAGGLNRDYLRRALTVLRDAGYVEVTHLNFKMLRVRILNQKKFGSSRQKVLPFDQEPLRKNAQYSAARPLKSAQWPLKSAQSKQTLEVTLEKPLKPDSRENTAPAPRPPLSVVPAPRSDRQSVEAQAFEIFWEQYPLQTFRGRAWNVFHIEKCTVDLGEILIGLAAWKESGAFDDLSHAYFAHNFLHQQIWKEKPRPRKETRSVKRARNNAAALQKILGGYAHGGARPRGRELPD